MEAHSNYTSALTAAIQALPPLPITPINAIGHAMELYNADQGCPICLEPLVLVGMPCRHGVCASCMVVLLEDAIHAHSAVHCPICRAVAINV